MQELETLSIRSTRGGKRKLLTAGDADGEAGGWKKAWENVRQRFLSGEKEGYKPFPWKSLSMRNLLIAASAVLILLAAYLNLRFAQDAGGGTGEDTPPLLSQTGTESTTQDDYFAVAVINRSRVRDEAIDMYQAVADDAAATQTSRDEAYASMNALVDQTAAEVDIENSIKAKGFANCVAILDGGRANIIVETSGLTDAEVAQITEIVYLQAGIIPQNLTITEKV